MRNSKQHKIWFDLDYVWDVHGSKVYRLCRLLLLSPPTCSENSRDGFSRNLRFGFLTTQPDQTQPNLRNVPTHLVPSTRKDDAGSRDSSSYLHFRIFQEGKRLHNSGVLNHAVMPDSGLFAVTRCPLPPKHSIYFFTKASARKLKRSLNRFFEHHSVRRPRIQSPMS